MGSETDIAIKVTHAGQTKRVTLPRADLTYESLGSWITAAFSLKSLNEDGIPARVAYRDPEGDAITIGSTEELTEAIRLTSDSVLTLHVSFPRARERLCRMMANGDMPAAVSAESNETEEHNAPHRRFGHGHGHGHWRHHMMQGPAAAAAAAAAGEPATLPESKPNWEEIREARRARRVAFMQQQMQSEEQSPETAYRPPHWRHRPCGAEFGASPAHGHGHGHGQAYAYPGMPPFAHCVPPMPFAPWPFAAPMPTVAPAPHAVPVSHAPFVPHQNGHGHGHRCQEKLARCQEKMTKFLSIIIVLSVLSVFFSYAPVGRTAVPFLAGAGALLAFVVRKRHVKAGQWRAKFMHAHHAPAANLSAPAAASPAASSPAPSSASPIAAFDAHPRRCRREQMCAPVASAAYFEPSAPAAAAEPAPHCERRQWRARAAAEAVKSEEKAVEPKAPSHVVVSPPAAAAAAVNTNEAPVHQGFRQDLLRLHAMGFTDVRLNRRLLHQLGDINAVVASLTELNSNTDAAADKRQ